MYYIGMDLGTSAVKLLLVDQAEDPEYGDPEYPLEFPPPRLDRAEPEDWLRAVLRESPN